MNFATIFYQYDFDDYSNLSPSISENTEELLIAMDCTYEYAGTTWKAFILFNFIVMYVLPCLVSGFSGRLLLCN